MRHGSASWGIIDPKLAAVAMRSFRPLQVAVLLNGIILCHAANIDVASHIERLTTFVNRLGGSYAQNSRG